MDLATPSPDSCRTPKWAAMLVLTLFATTAAAQGPAIRSGTLVFPVADGEPVAIQRLRSDVKVQVNGIVAHIELTQRFRNPSDQWAEGIYAFPVPANAGIERLSIVLDGRLTSDVRRKVQPQQLYDAARGARRLSSAARPSAPSLLRAPVADIGPRATVDITVGYVQMLDHGLDRQRLRIPLAANRGPLPDLSVEAGLLTTPASDSSWLQISNAGTQRPTGTTQPVNVHISIDAGWPLTGVTSRHHAIRVLGAEHSTIICSDERASAEHDFELEWTPDARHLPPMPLARTADDDARLLSIAAK